MIKPFQRKGSSSNTQVGNDFEAAAREYFLKRRVNLSRRFSVDIGVNGLKPHNFDLGNLVLSSLI